MNVILALRQARGRFVRRQAMKRQCAGIPEGDLLRFRCNICSRKNVLPIKSLTREGSSCHGCTSSVRMRSVIHALSMELFQKSLMLKDFPERRDITGIGMSDWHGYSEELEKKFAYTNTFYHQEPFLDLVSEKAASFGQFDFVICSDVVEHIAPPVQRAFTNARHLLKPDGVLIFSVPYRAGETQEHYPNLSEYSTRLVNDQWILENKTADGQSETFADVTFHGGPGTVIEMRVFGKDALLRHFAEAGFAPPTIHTEEERQFGIVWNPYIAEEAPYRPLIHGLDAPPWGVRNPAA